MRRVHQSLSFCGCALSGSLVPTMLGRLRPVGRVAAGVLRGNGSCLETITSRLLKQTGEAGNGECEMGPDFRPMLIEFAMVIIQV